MPLTFMSSKKYRNYTESDMTNALINIKTRRMSVMNASKTFKIPQRTLYYRIKKTLEEEKYTNIEPEIIIEEKPYLIEETESISEEKLDETIIKIESISEEILDETIIKIESISEEKLDETIIKIESISEETIESISEEKLKITHEIDILEQQIEDDQIKNKSELLRRLFLLKLASK